jgi:hypothetical protein
MSYDATSLEAARAVAYRYLGHSARSHAEMERRLTRAGFLPELYSIALLFAVLLLAVAVRFNLFEPFENISENSFQFGVFLLECGVVGFNIFEFAI